VIRTAGPRALDAWPWLVAAAGVGALAVVQPLVAVAAVAAVAVVAAAFAAPAAAVGVTVVVVLFVRPIEHLVPIALLGYLDEGLVLLCGIVLPLRRLLAGRALRAFPGQWWFAAFAAAGLLSGLFLDVPPETYLLGAVVMCKGLVFAWAVAQVDWEERHLRVAARTGAALIIFCLLATAANLALQGPWNAVMASDPNAIESRGFLPSLIGPFSHPIDLGQFMAFSAIALTAWRMTVRKGAFTLTLLLATAGAALLTARRTAIGSLVAAWLWLKAVGRSTGVLLAVAVTVPFAAVVLATPLATVVTATYNDYISPQAEPAARTVLTVDSFGVAAGYFPGGAGFGRFGSAIAASTYSPEYFARGYPDIWGLGRTAEDGRFLTDTEWPAIIGESGYLGAAAFLVGMILIYRASRRLYRHGATPLVRWIGLVAIGWTIASLVQSIATVTFTGPPGFGLFFGMVGLVTGLSARNGAPEAGPRPQHTDRSMIVSAAPRRAAPQLARLDSGTAAGSSRGRT
jgi:hypothetical protein